MAVHMGGRLCSDGVAGVCLLQGYCNKMIRYVSQKEVDLAARSPRIRHEAVPPQDSPSTLAFRNLKRDNAQRAMLQGRLSVLQIQEERSDFKEMQRQERARFEQLIREEQEEELRRKQQYREQRQAQAHLEQQLAREEREAHQANLRKALLQLSSSRTGGRQRKQALEHELVQLRLQDELTNQQRRQQIREYEKQQRQNMKEYSRLRRAQLQERESQEVAAISEIRQQRARQIQQLAELELGIMNNSRLSQQNSEMRVSSVRERKSNSTVLPSIPSPYAASPYAPLP